MNNDLKKFKKYYEEFISILGTITKAEQYDQSLVFEKFALGLIDQRKYEILSRDYINVNLKAKNNYNALLETIKPNKSLEPKSVYHIFLKMISLDMEILELWLKGVKENNLEYIYTAYDKREPEKEMLIAIFKELRKEYPDEGWPII